MLKLQHPASLNALQQYRQACQVLKRTSRASNPAWYQQAVELEQQLHIRSDGASITTHFLQKSSHTWTAGPPLNEATLKDPEKAAAFARDVMAYARSKGAKAVGIVLHIANEFATAELKPEFDEPAMLHDLREAAVDDPSSILDDSSVPIEQASWRVVPYPAEGSEVIAAAVILSRQAAPFLDVLRETGEAHNFPIITHALSAPLVALTAFGSLASPTEGKPFVGIFQYPWFTVVGFFNPQGELKLIRTMQHRGRKRVTNFRHALNTTNISLEIIDPDVFVIPLGEDVDHMLGSDLQISMPESRIEVVQPPPDLGALPSWCIEPWLAANTGDKPNRLRSETLRLLQDEQWALQNFLPVPREIAELYPTRTEMQLLRFSKLARVALFLLALGGIGWFGYGYATALQQPEWAFNEPEANILRTQLTALNQERTRSDHWHNLLADRSKAWIAMEDLVHMFPENSGIKVRNYQYTVRPETSPRQTAAGFVREWRITGLTRPDGAARLNELNTREGISAHFAEVARITGNQAYLTDEATRNIVVSVRTQENRQSRSPSAQDFANDSDESYPFTFDLIISQHFDPDDPLALKVTAAP